MGPLTIEPVLDQVITQGATAADETTIADSVTNYTKEINEAGFDTRVVPYDGGLLIAYTNYMSMKKFTLFAAAKKEFRDGNEKKLEELRTELKANP